MGWHIDVMENTIALSVEQAERLVNILENTWGDYGIYLHAHGDKQALIELFSGETIEFDSDCMEHMDYLQDGDMQAAFVAIGARGFVTLGDFHGDSQGYAWTHEFTDAGYSYGVGEIRQLVDGKMPLTA